MMPLLIFNEQENGYFSSKTVKNCGVQHLNEDIKINSPIETSTCSFPDKPRPTVDPGIPVRSSRSFDIFETRYVVGVPNRDSKFYPTEQDVQQEKLEDEQYFTGKQVKAKELDDDTGQHPCEDLEVESLNENLEEEDISSPGASDQEHDKFDHEVADNLKVKINNSSKVLSISSSNLSRNSKKRKKQKKNGHLLHVPKVQKERKIKKTPQSTTSKAGTSTNSKNINNQIACTHRNRNIVSAKTVNRRKIVDNGYGGSDSDEQRSNKKQIPADYDSNADKDERMSSDSSNSDNSCPAQKNDPVIAQVVHETEQIQTVRARWDSVKHKLQNQVSREAIEKAREELLKKIQIIFSELSPVYQKLTQQVSQNVIHSAYCQSEECPQGKLCQWIKNTLVPHYLHHQDKQTCGLCKCANSALYIHTLRCQLPGHCDVWQCNDIKQSIQDSAKIKEYAKGTVLYSGTTIWKEGDILFEDEDYCFFLKKPIGQGSFGKVYRAWVYDCKTTCEADVAVKEARYKLHEEAVVVKTLGDRNPYILKTQGIINLNNRDNSGLVIMELCECSLLDYLYDYIRENNTRGLTIDDAVYFFVQILDGVTYMHSKSIIHKDLKAKNIFLMNNCQRIKIGDWDSAVRLKDEVTAANLEPKGTQGYAAPEVVAKKPHGYPADIYSLGCCLLELLFGNQYKIDKEGRQKEIDELATRDPELAALVMQCVADEPKERPTAKEIFYHPAVRKYLKGNKPKAPEPFRITGKHMKDDAVLKVSAEQLECHIGLKDKAVMIEDQPVDSILKMMDDLPKELPPIHGPTTSNWDMIVQLNTSDDCMIDGIETPDDRRETIMHTSEDGSSVSATAMEIDET